MNSFESVVPSENPERSFLRRRNNESLFLNSAHFVSRLIFDEADYVINLHRAYGIGDRVALGTTIHGYKGSLHIAVEQNDGQEKRTVSYKVLAGVSELVYSCWIDFMRAGLSMKKQL